MYNFIIVISVVLLVFFFTKLKEASKYLEELMKESDELDNLILSKRRQK